MTAVVRLLDDYRQTALKWDEAQADHRTANPLFKHLHAVYKQLRDEPDGRVGIRKLMADPSTGVRLMAATHSLAWFPAIAEQVLEAIQTGPGLYAVDAEYTLRAHRDGTLNLDW
jgi:hypothetical protein